MLLKDSEIANTLLLSGNPGNMVISENNHIYGDIPEEVKEELKKYGITLIPGKAFYCG